MATILPFGVKVQPIIRGVGRGDSGSTTGPISGTVSAAPAVVGVVEDADVLGVVDVVTVSGDVEVTETAGTVVAPRVAGAVD